MQLPRIWLRMNLQVASEDNLRLVLELVLVDNNIIEVHKNAKKPTHTRAICSDMMTYWCPVVVP